MKKLFTFLLGLSIVGLLGVGKAYAFDIEVGNDPVSRANIDTYHNFTIVDTNEMVQYDGFLTEFEYWASNTNPFKFLILDSMKTVLYKTDLIIPDSQGLNTYLLPDLIPVNSGWHVGLYFQTTGTIPFDYNVNADPAYYSPNNDGEPLIGEIIVPAGYTDRYYSFMAYGWSGEDLDSDGVLDYADLCPDTTGEDGEWDRDWGTNRWQVMEDENGVLGWYQNKPVGKGNTLAEFKKGLDYTYGCNGHQILEMIETEIGSVMLGHHKFGLSTSVVQEFHDDMGDGILNGRYFIDSLNVPATSGAGISTFYNALVGITYDLEVSGTYKFVNWPSPYGFADAEYSNRIAGHTSFSTAGWEIGEDYFLMKYGVANYALDLLVDGENIYWGDYNDSHTYTKSIDGTGNPLHFNIFDNAYGDNSGFLTVHVYANL